VAFGTRTLTKYDKLRAAYAEVVSNIVGVLVLFQIVDMSAEQYAGVVLLVNSLLVLGFLLTNSEQ